MGSRSGIPADQLERYLEAGYVVASIDYRLAPETKLPAIIEDLQDAFSWLRSEGSGMLGTDPDRVGVVGSSAGGYLALMAGHCVQPSPRALVSFYGYSDIVGSWFSQPDSFYNTFGPVAEAAARLAVGTQEIVDAPVAERWDYYLWCRQNGLWLDEVGGHDPHSEPGWFHYYCPAQNVSSPGISYPPTLLLHGDADTDVPHSQSVHMAGRLDSAGVDHELITIPDGSHGFDKKASASEDPVVTAAIDKVLEFLRKHV